MEATNTSSKPKSGSNEALLQQVISSKNGKKSITENVYVLLTLFSGVLFLVLTLAFTFLLVIPRFQSISAKRAQITQLEEQYDRLVKKRDALAAIDTTTLNSDLEVVNRSIPSDLDVAELASLVKIIAAKYSLEVRTLNLDQSQGDTGGNLKFSVNDIEVTTIVGPFGFVGSKGNISKFLQDWYNSEYALRFSEIQLAQQDDGVDVWSLDLRILGYSMPLVENIRPEVDLPVLNQELLNELKQ